MELRILELALRILDPRKWRLRLAQLLGAVFATGWVLFRSVDRAPIGRAVRDERWAQRRQRIRAENVARERARRDINNIVDGPALADHAARY